MTSYHGGKQRIGKQLAEVIVNKSLNIAHSVDKGWTIKGYCEPFCGMLGVYQHIPELFKEEGLFLKKYKAGDTNKSVIMMWEDAKRGWEPPTTMTEKKYNKLKDGPDSAVKCFVGHQYSFGGQYFKGYSHKYGKTGNYPRTRARIKNTARKMSKTVFKHGSYTQYSNLKDYVIYCDPPYNNSHQWYREEGTFDSKEFFEWCRKMSEHNIVFVTEYKAPRDFEKVWSKNIKMTGKMVSQKYGKGSYTLRVENLYLVNKNKK